MEFAFEPVCDQLRTSLEAASVMEFGFNCLYCVVTSYNKNSSGDEIANVNFFYNIAHVEASAYAH